MERGRVLPAQYDHQRVKLTATVTLKAGDAAADYRVRWVVEDPDDPATHQDIDLNGDKGGDNGFEFKDTAGNAMGHAHENADHWFTTADAANPATAQADGFAAPASGNLVVGTAETGLDANLGSSVYLNFSDTAGDNYRVKAELYRVTGVGANQRGRSPAPTSPAR